MNKEILIACGKYDLISELTGKSKKAIKQKFWRSGKTIKDIEFVKEYLSKFM